MNSTLTLLGSEFIGVETTIGLVLILVNSVELFIFVKGLDTLKLQKCVISLIISDILFGLVAIPMCISVVLGYPKDVLGCSLVISVYMTIESLETLCIMLNLVEKFFAKLYPIKFIIHATGRKINGL